MAHGIYLFDPAQARPREPRSLADFGDILRMLEQAPGAPNPRFELFAQQLMKACAERPYAAEWNWPGDPLEEAGRHTRALWHLQLPVEDPVRAAMLAVDSARRVGLASYDDELGLGFLPDGRVFPAERQGEWDTALEALDENAGPATRAGMRTQLRHELEAALAAHGFVFDAKLARSEKADLAFARAIAGGLQKVIVYLEGGDPLRCSIHCRAELDAVRELRLGVARHPDYLPQAWTYTFELRELAADFEASRLFLEPEERRRAVVQLLVAKALPLLDRSQDIAGIDWLMNDPGSPLHVRMKRSSSVSALAVAHFAGRGDFDAFADDLEASAARRVDGTPVQLARLREWIESRRAAGA